MTITIKEAQSKLAEIMDRAASGEEIVIADQGTQSAVKLVPVATASRASRLDRHPDLAGSTHTTDPQALVRPLEKEEWDWMAES